MKLQGNIFRVREKKNEKGPDMRGDVKDENGIEWEVAGWTKESEKAGKYLSLSIKPKGDYVKPDNSGEQQSSPTSSPENSKPTDLPF
jgi:hypothetical protein